MARFNSRREEDCPWPSRTRVKILSLGPDSPYLEEKRELEGKEAILINPSYKSRVILPDGRVRTLIDCELENLDDPDGNY